MNIRGPWAGLTILLLAATAGLSADLDLRQHQAVQESLSRVHPRFRAEWLRERGLDDSYYTTFHPQDTDSGLRCIGRWPWGPSWELCGRDSLLFLGSGSGVRILSITDSIHPRQLGQIACRSLVHQLALQDSLLFVACGSWGAQMFSVSDPTNPREVGSVNAFVGNLCVVDTFCYTLGNDTMRAFNVADPTAPVQTFARYDQGGDIAETRSHLYVAGGSGVGMNVYDISNPATPTWVNSRGGAYLTLWAQDTLLLCSGEQPSYFAILNVSNPLNITQVGNISGYGGHGLYADDYLAYLSRGYEYEGITIIDIANPTNPQVRGSYDPEGNSCYDPYVPRLQSYGYITDDFGGLIVLDLHDVYSPSEVWSGYKADLALDISISHSLAVIADQQSGAQLVDISDPAAPTTLGLFDTVGARFTYSTAVADSFAFISMSGIPGRRFLRALDISDPSNPVLAAQESCFNPPNDLVLRDSFIYAAEMNRFQIFNVARPREPVLVGSCVAGDATSAGLWLQDTLAYVANYQSQVVNISNPAVPWVIGSFGRGAWDIVVVDTVAFLTTSSLVWYSVADPAAPRAIDSVYLGFTARGLVVRDTLAYVGSLNDLCVVSVADLHAPRVISRAPLPYGAKRIEYSEPYVYAACWDAGVCILDTAVAGIHEQSAARIGAEGPTRGPTVTRCTVTLEIPGTASREVKLSAYDVTGQLADARVLLTQGTRVRYSLAQLPTGLYVLTLRTGKRVSTIRVVKL
jgi:hypothetical protein